VCRHREDPEAATGEGQRKVLCHENNTEEEMLQTRLVVTGLLGW
jgi:hypothetical protein